MQHFMCKKGIILSSSDKNCFILSFISVKKTKIGFMSVDKRTASAQYLKGFLKNRPCTFTIPLVVKLNSDCSNLPNKVSL